MKVSIFGATGMLGGECVREALEAGHDVTVLARTPSKLEVSLRDRVRIIEGDGLDAASVKRTLEIGSDAVLFAIGVDKKSPENLCTDITRHILDVMPELGVKRFVWCGGGASLVEDDVVTFGARFVVFYSKTFLGLRHRDKVHQLQLLGEHHDIEWVGIRPLQMHRGEKRGNYRLGFNSFGGMSRINAADCAHAMVGALSDDTWLHKAPIIQY